MVTKQTIETNQHSQHILMSSLAIWTRGVTIWPKAISERVDYVTACESEESEGVRRGGLTVAQAAVVPAAPGEELAVGRDGGAVGAPAGDLHHLLPRLLPVERRDHGRLLQVPGEPRTTVITVAAAAFCCLATQGLM